VEGVASGPHSERQYNARKHKNNTIEASMLLKTQDGIGKRTQNELKNEPGFECQMRELNSNSELFRAACVQAGGIAPRNAEGHGKGPRSEAWSNPRKIQEIYDRSQYVIENTGSASKNEPKTNSKRSLFERKMDGLDPKSRSVEISPDGIIPSGARNLALAHLFGERRGRARFVSLFGMTKPRKTQNRGNKAKKLLKIKDITF
jgi:hypothetical protein